MGKFTKKIIKKGKKTKKMKKVLKDTTPNIGYYKNEKDCRINTVKRNEITNPKFTSFPNIFDQTYFTSGDVADFEKYGLLPLRSEKLKKYSSKNRLNCPTFIRTSIFSRLKTLSIISSITLKKGFSL